MLSVLSGAEIVVPNELDLIFTIVFDQKIFENSRARILSEE